MWDFIKDLPASADAWWQDFKQKTPFEQGKMLGNGAGQIAFEVLLGVLTAGATSALKATGYGARIIATSSKVTKIVGSFGDELATGARRLLNDIDDALLPQHIVTHDGRKFQVRRNDVLDGDKPQMMKMEGNKDGGGFEDRKKKEENGNEKKKQQHEADDRLDEHDLSLIEDDERDALFKRDAERGIYRGKLLRNEDMGRPLELDRVDITNKVIIEDKKAKGFEMNPKGIDIAIDNWAKKNIYNNAKKKIDFLENRADHIFNNVNDPLSSPYSPSLSKIKDIKHIRYKLKNSFNAYEGKLKNKVDEVIEQLNNEHPGWKIDIEYK